jgi:hypothetical protein
MTRYQSSTPRVTFAVAALGLTAITFGLLVGMPAAFGGCDQDAYVATAINRDAPTATEVVINPSVIEIIAVREARPMTVDAGSLPTKRARQG